MAEQTSVADDREAAGSSESSKLVNSGRGVCSQCGGTDRVYVTEGGDPLCRVCRVADRLKTEKVALAPVSFLVRVDMWSWLTEYADERKVSVSRVVKSLIEDYVGNPSVYSGLEFFQGFPGEGGMRCKLSFLMDAEVYGKFTASIHETTNGMSIAEAIRALIDLERLGGK